MEGVLNGGGALELWLDVRGTQYAVDLTPQSDGGYVVTSPDMPGLVTEGDTFDEAMRAAVEAAEAWLDTMGGKDE